MQMTVTIRIAAADYNTFLYGQSVEVRDEATTDEITIEVTVPSHKIMMEFDGDAQEHAPYATYRPFA